MITVTPSMIAAAQEAFLAAWRIGSSPDWSIRAAVRATVEHINNEIKDRKS